MRRKVYEKDEMVNTLRGIYVNLSTSLVLGLLLILILSVLMETKGSVFENVISFFSKLIRVYFVECMNIITIVTLFINITINNERLSGSKIYIIRAISDHTIQYYLSF